jgi:hypothetical protein
LSIGGGWPRLRSGGAAVDAARERGGASYIARPPPKPHERPEEAAMSPDLTALDQEQRHAEPLEHGGIVRSSERYNAAASICRPLPAPSLLLLAPNQRRRLQSIVTLTQV